MRIHFYGAAREVTGSCYLVEIHALKVLVDCGLFQGTSIAGAQNHAAFAFDPTTVEAVLVTHAHLDHGGRIPKLVQEGFRGKIICSEPTAALLKLIWEDAVSIMRYNHEKNGEPMLYDETSVERTVRQLHPVPYHEPVRIGQEAVATFSDAGHILGSAWIALQAGEKRVVFSGDVGNDNVPIVRETEPIGQADVVICESTYGDRAHEDATVRSAKLKEVVEEAAKRGGALMIPAFSLERTQEILYELNWLIEECKCLPRMPIYLDSPLAIDATAIFKKFTNYYDSEALARRTIDGDLFSFPGLKVTGRSRDSRLINEVANPKIIIAGSGMMNGGRIMHHLVRYLPDPNSTLLILCYQAEGTTGRKVQSGAPVVTIAGERVPVHCKIVTLHSYSAHGDQDKLMRWLSTGQPAPKHVYVTHGDPNSQDALVGRIEKELGIGATAPQLGRMIEV